MTFTWPLALLLVLAVPLLLGIYLLSLRRRRRQAVRYSSVALLRSVLPRRSRWKRHLPVALLLASIAPPRARGGPAPADPDRVDLAHFGHPGPGRVPVHVRHRRQPQSHHRGPARGQRLRPAPAGRRPHRSGCLRRPCPARGTADDRSRRRDQSDRQSLDVVRHRHWCGDLEVPRRHRRGGPGRQAGWRRARGRAERRPDRAGTDPVGTGPPLRRRPPSPRARGATRPT